jgi:hypothetical protein
MPINIKPFGKNHFCNERLLKYKKSYLLITFGASLKNAKLLKIKEDIFALRTIFGKSQ